MIREGADLNKEGAALIADVAETIVAICNDPVSQKANKLQVKNSIKVMLEIMDDLRAAGANINAKNNKGMTGLMILNQHRNEVIGFLYGTTELEKLLKWNAADISLTNAEEETAADLAPTKEIMSLLEGMI